jgi:hypothetical protein
VGPGRVARGGGNKHRMGHLHDARTGEGEGLTVRPGRHGGCGTLWATALVAIDELGPLLGAWPDETVPAFN